MNINKQMLETLINLFESFSNRFSIGIAFFLNLLEILVIKLHQEKIIF
jgi:hypothetical protein